MKILYVTRHFNRSGYYIFKRILEERKNYLSGIVLFKKVNLLDMPFLSDLELFRYYLEVKFYNGEYCKFTKSIKKLAKKSKVPIMETRNINSDDFYNKLKLINPGLLVVAGGWHQLLSTRVINFSKKGVINVHPSLLPNFRGTDVHRWQIYEGVRKSGITIHYIDECFDTGNIIAQKSIEVSMECTPQILFDKVAKISADLMMNVLTKIENSKGKIKGRPQDAKEDDKKYFSKWNWDDSNFLEINWEKETIDIYNFIRASHQESYKYKGPYFVYKGKQIIVRKAKIINEQNIGPGRIYYISNDGFGVGTKSKDRILFIEKIQEGGKFRKIHRAKSANKFITKYRLKEGDSINNAYKTISLCF